MGTHGEGHRRFIGWVDNERTVARAASYSSGSLVASVEVGLVAGRARLRPASWRALSADPVLVERVCGWARRNGAHDVVVQIDDDGEAASAGILTALGFRAGDEYLTYGRDLVPGDAGPVSTAVREVGADHGDLERLAATRLLGTVGGRPSGAELLADVRRLDGVRAWTTHDPVRAGIITQRVGHGGHIVVAAHSADAEPGLMTSLVHTAFTGMLADGATHVAATVASSNERSRRLCERFGLEVTGGGSWWCRSLHEEAAF